MHDNEWDGLFEVEDVEIDAPAEAVAYIELGTENCEVFDIPFKWVIEMDIEGIYERQTLRPGSSLIERSKSCQRVHLKLGKNGDIEEDYDGEFSNSAYRRLKHFNDIVDIAYLNADREIIDRIYVPWDENGDDEENGYSESEIDADGNLIIDIRK